MEDAIRLFRDHGYYVAPQLFSPAEIATFRAHYMQVRSEGHKPGDFAGVPLPPKDAANSQSIPDPLARPPAGDEKPDPLQKYPRLIHMHRWDDLSRDWLLDARLRDIMTALLGTEPYAVQTMLYFKPPGARGQALHQDQFYLKVQPGTCMAAWLALDDCDIENGCMQIVEGSHTWDVLCTVPADTRESFTDVTVPLPAGVSPTPVRMKAGDVLFFNGQLVHGSYANRTEDRFRRSLIGHYIVGDAKQVGEFYHPVLRFDGTVADDLAYSQGADKCGIWVDENGEVVMELVGKGGQPAPDHE